MKKWTYLLAAGLLAGATPVFTGCIDNDEPEGITILRGAKAELIRAKVAVEKANALKAEAEAAYRKAEAEVKAAEKLILEAQAKKLEAETEAMKQKIEAEIKKIEAEAQKQLELAKKAAQAAADAHAQALEDLKKLQAATAKEQSEALQIWMNRYDEKKQAYDAAYLAWVDASRKYTKQLAEDEQTGKDPEQLEELRLDVKKAERALAQAKKYEEELKAELEEAEKMEPSELQVKRNNVQKELVAAQDKIAQIAVEKAELKQANIDKYAAVEKAVTALAELEKEEVEIKPFTFEFPEIGSIPGYYGEKEVLEEGLKFKMDSYGIVSGDYDVAETKLKNEVENIKHLLLDEDDVAWTQARINELTRKGVGLQEQYAIDLNLWKMAVKGYNLGAGEVDLTVFTGYNEMAELIPEYNSFKDEHMAKKAAWENAKLAYQDAVNALVNTPESHDAKLAYENALKNADAAFNAVVEEAWKTYNTLESTLMTAIQEASKNAAVKYKELDAAKARLEADPENQEYKDAVKAAEEAYNKAYNAIHKAQQKYHADTDVAKQARDKAIQLAKADCMDAKAKAQQKYNEQVKEWGGEKDPALQENVDAALEAVNAAYDELSDLIEHVNDDVLMSIFNYCDLYNAAVNYASGYDMLQEIVKANRALLSIGDFVELDIETVKMTIEKAKELVKFRSQILYGDPSTQEEYWDGKYQIPAEFLIEKDKEDIRALIKEYDADIKEYEIAQEYGKFGSFGKVLENQNKIDLAKAYIADNHYVDEVLKGLNEALAALEASKENQELRIETAIANIEAAQQVVVALEEPLNQKESEAKAEKAVLDEVLLAIDRALAECGSGQPTEENIKDYIKQLEEAIVAAEDQIIMKTASKEKADAALAKYEAGDYSKSDILKAEMEDAAYAKDEAKKAMDKAEEDMNKAIEKIEKAIE